MDEIENNNLDSTLSYNEPKQEDSIFLFKCIVDFIHCLRDLYGENQHSLELYDLLMEKTGIVHEEPIKKHIHLFYEFVRENEEAIIENSPTLIKQWKIEYSDKVYIDLKPIFEECSEGDIKVLWQHLLTLLAVLIPTSQAKQILKEQKNKKKKKNKKRNTNSEGNNEDDFLSNIMDKVGKHIDPSKASNPAEMMNGIMSSGLFGELMEDMNKGMSSGDLDISKMMGSLQGMIGNLSTMMDNANKSS